MRGHSIAFILYLPLLNWLPPTHLLHQHTFDYLTYTTYAPNLLHCTGWLPIERAFGRRASGQHSQVWNHTC